MYMTPRTLGSVVRMYARNFDPRAGRATGYGRVATGRGATAVTGCLQQVGTAVTHWPPARRVELNPTGAGSPAQGRVFRRRRPASRDLCPRLGDQGVANSQRPAA